MADSLSQAVVITSKIDTALADSLNSLALQSFEGGFGMAIVAFTFLAAIAMLAVGISRAISV